MLTFRSYYHPELEAQFYGSYVYIVPDPNIRSQRNLVAREFLERVAFFSGNPSVILDIIDEDYFNELFPRD